MIEMEMSFGGHKWEKKSLINQMSRKGIYDIYKCERCGMEGKSYRLGTIEISDRDYNKNKGICRCRKDTKKIKILRVNAAGIEFKSLIPGSIHDVIDPPAGYDNSRGVWVMGYSEPVLVLFGEYDEFEEGGES